MRDDAQQTHYFNNAVIAPTGKYEYDPLYRLMKAEGRELSSLNAPDYGDFANNIPVPNPSANAMQNYTQLFVYDELGNIQSMSSQNRWTRTYNYSNSVNNYLSNTQVGQDIFSYTYDSHGNMTSMPHLPSMQWDFADRLREVELNLSGDTAYYIYDSTGNRCRKVVVKGSIREERYYLEGYEVFRKFVSGDLDFERQTLHVSDDTKKFATLETKTIENATPVNPIVAEIRYQYDNHLGSACLELDQTAQIITYEEYHPFGTTSYRSGRAETEVSLKRYKYVGKERDEETGLYYYGARYYATWICRFVSVDALQFKYPELTPYQYASNGPVAFIDLDGLEKVNKDVLQANKDASSILKKYGNNTIIHSAIIGYTSPNPERKEAAFKELKQKAISYTGITPMNVPEPNGLYDETFTKRQIDYYKWQNSESGFKYNSYYTLLETIYTDIVTLDYAQKTKGQDFFNKINNAQTDTEKAKLIVERHRVVLDYQIRVGLLTEAAKTTGILMFYEFVGSSVNLPSPKKFNVPLQFSNVAAKGESSWVYGAFKSGAKWAGQLSKRGWTAEQITEAVTKGKSFDAVNMVNKANSATRYVHPITGQSVVIDNVTKELLHVGGSGFKY